MKLDEQMLVISISILDLQVLSFELLTINTVRKSFSISLDKIFPYLACKEIIDFILTFSSAIFIKILLEIIIPFKIYCRKWTIRLTN